MMKKVYLDNAATTKVDPQIFKAMEPYFSKKYGNASEPHFWGQEARAAIDKSRGRIAQFLAVKPGEIIFTSCATESINFAHKGLIEAMLQKDSGIKNSKDSKKFHIITSSIEHKAVLESCRHLEKLGWAEVTYLPVDRYGMVEAEDIEKAVRPGTVLVSVMYANNEVGTVEPIEEIGRLVKKINLSRASSQLPPIFFHTDATQAVQYLDCQVERLGVDMLSFSGHKIYAPKGVGVLFVKKGVPLIRQQDGGDQEYRLRAGTENVPYIVAIGEAVQMIDESERKESKRIAALRDWLVRVALTIDGVRLTGHPRQRVPHIASFVVEGVEGEAILLHLSDRGVAAASGSACTSGILKPSHVLTAMGIAPELSHGSLRFSLSKNTTRAEIDYVLKILPEIIGKLRAMAPKGI